MTPEQAVAAVAALKAQLAVPIHTGGYDFKRFYQPVAEAAARFVAVANERSVRARQMTAGEMLDLDGLPPTASGHDLGGHRRRSRTHP